MDSPAVRGGHTGPDTLTLYHNPPKMCRTAGGGGGEETDSRACMDSTPL